MEPTRKVAVIGAGLMGHGIAQVFAQAGHQVSLMDRSEEVLGSVRGRIAANLQVMGHDPDPVLDRIQLTSELGAAVEQAEVVIEAAPERLELKRRLFAEIVAFAPEHAILASNTSVIPITDIGAELPPQARARLVGNHWWNPPHLVPLVEVVRGEHTDPGVFQRSFELLQAVGKQPVKVMRDVAGFVGNRLQHAMWREALALVDDGVCDPETIDLVVKNSFGMRLPVLGPMENIDLIGLELVRNVHEVLFPHLSCAQEPAAGLSRRLEAGKRGMASGEGMLRWTEESAAAVRRALSGHLLGLRDRN